MHTILCTEASIRQFSTAVCNWTHKLTNRSFHLHRIWDYNSGCFHMQIRWNSCLLGCDIMWSGMRQQTFQINRLFLSSVFNCEDGSSMFLQNAGDLPDCMATHPRRLLFHWCIHANDRTVHNVTVPFLLPISSHLLISLINIRRC